MFKNCECCNGIGFKTLSNGNEVTCVICSGKKGWELKEDFKKQEVDEI